jgi:glycine/D-amino acid oxidase-like deaminating enzyme
MDLRTDAPFWLMRNGLLQSYPTLHQNIEADYAIMGGGITGALVAWHLAEAGFSVVVLDRRHVGMGSTCASTALLQYEIDTPLSKLVDYVGEQDAARSYQLCIEAIYKLQALSKKIPITSDFEIKPSFYYASKKADVEDLKAELLIRKKHGIDVEWMDASDVEKAFPFKSPAALWSTDGAQVDAFRLAHGLMQAATKKGLQVYNQTEVVDIEHQRNGVKLTTQKGCIVKAKELIIASGYESHLYLSQRVIRLHSTYAIISEPMDQKELWKDNCLIWETARPYLYMRTTADNRILVGGKDETFASAIKRDKLLTRKTHELTDTFARKFPDLAFQADFQWAGTFAETADGLPYIGRVNERPHTTFALGFGGNGIVFSLIAAEIIRDQALGKKNADAQIFAFGRKQST